MPTTLNRPRRGDGRVIAGVCGGLAHRFGLSPFMVRLGFVIFGLVGAGEVAYIVLWIIMPNAPR
ncbi:MAG TPA: PspC domain-containing protein [Euzebya sp.]|nr:PspC domain-containing protein [Euzebya sp.]